MLRDLIAFIPVASVALTVELEVVLVIVAVVDLVVVVSQFLFCP